MQKVRLVVSKESGSIINPAAVKGQYRISAEFEGEPLKEISFPHRGSKYLYLLTVILSAKEGLNTEFLASDEGRKLARKVLYALYPSERMRGDEFIDSFLDIRRRGLSEPWYVGNHNFSQSIRNATAAIKDACKTHGEAAELLVPTQMPFKGHVKTRKLKLGSDEIVLPEELSNL